MASQTRLRSILGAAALSSLTLVAIAAEPLRPAAEVPRTPARPATSNPTTNNPATIPQRVTVNRPVDGTMTSPDHTIAQWLTLDNEMEVAMNRLASEKISNKKLREFADNMIKQHGQTLEQLRRFGGVAHQERGNADATVRTNANEAPANPPVAPRTSPNANPNVGATAQAQPAGFNFLEVKRRIGQQCLTSAREAYKDKEGRHADECYLGHQIVAHEHMIDTQKVLREYASPQLKALIDQNIQTAEQHLEQAKSLMHEVAAADHQDGDKREEKRTSADNSEK